jgi:hypothetical protein
MEKGKKNLLTKKKKRSKKIYLATVRFCLGGWGRGLDEAGATPR